MGKGKKVTTPRQSRLANGSDRGRTRVEEVIAALQNHSTLKDKVKSVSFIGPCVWVRLTGWPNKKDEMPFLSNHLHMTWNAERKRFVDYNGYKPRRASKLTFPGLVQFYQGATVFGQEV